MFTGVSQILMVIDWFLVFAGVSHILMVRDWFLVFVGVTGNNGKGIPSSIC